MKQDKMPNRIREIRIDKGFSQQELGQKVGTGNQQISKLETGALRMNDRWMTVLAKALGVRPYELLSNPFGIESSEELELLNRYRRLPDDRKKHVLDSISLLSGDPPKSGKKE